MVFCNNNKEVILKKDVNSHNPYFNRWFSAIVEYFKNKNTDTVTILILIDGFLQSVMFVKPVMRKITSQSLF